jgi:signal transduction histidine kinase
LGITASDRRGTSASPDDGLREGLRTLAYELTVAESRERDRIARELHDEIGQVLAVARFKLGELRGAQPEEREGLFDELSSLLAQAAQATRVATYELGAPALRLGLQEALISLVERCNRSAGPRFHLKGELPGLEWPEAVQAVLLRVVRELTLNVQRHARARRATVEVRHDLQQVVVSVVDDGVGIDPSAPRRQLSRDGGFGLHSAQAQVRALGGELRLESGLGAGTEVTVILPRAGRPQ